MTKEARIYSGEKTTCSINSVWKTGQLHAKESNWTTFSYYIQTPPSKSVKDLIVRHETIKVIEENIDSMLFDIGLSSIFLICLLRQGKQKQK